MRGARIVAHSLLTNNKPDAGCQIVLCYILVCMNLGRIEIPQRLFSSLAACIWIPFLPEKLRNAALKKYPINLDAAFLISTTLQLFLFLYLSVHGFFDYQDRLFDQVFGNAMKTGDNRVTVGFFMQSGLLSFLSYLLTVRGFFLSLAFVDAAIRLICYAILKEPLASIFCFAPVALYDVTKKYWDHLSERMEFGPEVPDEIQNNVEGNSEQIIILSARQKDWNPAITVRVRGLDYHPEAPVRVQQGNYFRYSYRLVRQHEHEIIRRLIIYQ